MGIADYDHFFGNGFAGTSGILVGHQVGNEGVVPAGGLCIGRLFGFPAIEGHCPINKESTEAEQAELRLITQIVF